MTKKNQLSLEFIVMLGIGMIFAAIFLLVANQLLNDTTRNQEFLAMRDLGQTIQSEIIFAARAESGYQRNFTIPTSVDRYAFVLGNTNTSFWIDYSQNRRINFAIPLIEGNLSIGNNMLVKNQSRIILQ
ncbi:hypothetical protein C4573_02065 [Candidatus Woesearchaeota archaeon]|nr:MAG: hypothetical protein C4573_02065 [Candidatus Woesearchaeota archaeon]